MGIEYQLVKVAKRNQTLLPNVDIELGDIVDTIVLSNIGPRINTSGVTKPPAIMACMNSSKFFISNVILSFLLWDLLNSSPIRDSNAPSPAK